MDANRFDRLARTLATRVPRRSALAAPVALALAGLPGRGGRPVAAKGKKCKKGEQRCRLTGQCIPKKGCCIENVCAADPKGCCNALAGEECAEVDGCCDTLVAGEEVCDGKWCCTPKSGQKCCPGIGCRPRLETCCAFGQRSCGAAPAEACCDPLETCTTGTHNGVARAACCPATSSNPMEAIIPCDGVCCATTRSIKCCPGCPNPCTDPNAPCCPSGGG